MESIPRRLSRNQSRKVKSMNSQVDYKGVFDVYENTMNLSSDELRQYMAEGVDIVKIPGTCLVGPKPNVLMQAQKIKMAQAVYPAIDRLIITNQTSTPSDTETGYTGAIYTSVETDEFYRSGPSQNPYQIAWNINADSANGAWGSFVLVDAFGSMINRALAGITKNSSTSILVQFSGLVTEVSG